MKQCAIYTVGNSETIQRALPAESLESNYTPKHKYNCNTRGNMWLYPWAMRQITETQILWTFEGKRQTLGQERRYQKERVERAIEIWGAFTWVSSTGKYKKRWHCVAAGVGGREWGQRRVKDPQCTQAVDPCLFPRVSPGGPASACSLPSPEVLHYFISSPYKLFIWEIADADQLW